MLSVQIENGFTGLLKVVHWFVQQIEKNETRIKKALGLIIRGF